ncbi:MAG: phasin family protein [Rhodovibrionaceae bacterium]|nr:phasin family protein [Rhodovibrionaceae bacterium]
MAKKTGNPFLDNDFNEMFDVNRFMEQFKVPGMEAQNVMEMQRKNMEAIAQANRVAFEGMQAVAQRNTEIMRQAMEDFTSALKDLSGSASPEARLAKQAELTKDAFERAIKNVRELSEMSAKSNTEALDLINKRVSENLDELTSQIKGLSQSKPGGGAKK